jgi:Protein of unknown function (DUF998)
VPSRLLALGFVTIVVALHAIRRDVSPLTRGISRYATRPTLVPATIAFLMLAAALGAAAWTEDSYLIAVAAVAIGGVAATPERLDPPHHDVTHTLFGFLFFVAAAAGIYTSRSSSPSIPRWIPAVLVALFFTGLAGAPGLSRIPGLLQRVCFIAIAAWLATT